MTCSRSRTTARSAAGTLSASLKAKSPRWVARSLSMWISSTRAGPRAQAPSPRPLSTAARTGTWRFKPRRASWRRSLKRIKVPCSACGGTTTARRSSRRARTG
eukprot:Amastigsp_a1066_7.p4 type:complete len:103 gc:universal Amastigsp_a1066_7:118-426(+)